MLCYNYFESDVISIIKSIIETFISIYSNNLRLLLETVILVILSILLKMYYPKFRGYMGELWVKLELNKLPKNKYIILNNVMIRNGEQTYQIDHIVLSEFGIFVIEMKNYYGLIRGREYDDEWCQCLGKTKNYFLNPLHQNYGHIMALSKLLNLENNCFISVICFSNQTKVDVKCNSIVTQVDYIKNEILKYDELIVNESISELAKIIMSNNILDRKVRKQHVRDVHNKINHNKKLENSMICPKCGNALVVKDGKYGIFIGCSGFPKCKYIKK